MMRDAIMNFAKQFEFEPQIENAETLRAAKRFIICGMGGSSQPANILQTVKPELDIIVHKDYGLPALPEERLQGSLVIVCSHSGNTEESIDAFHQAVKRKLNIIAISIGGQILDLAKQLSLPYIKIPDTKIQPRLALGFNYKALLKAMGQTDLLGQAAELAGILRPESQEELGRALAKKNKGFVPVIYASLKNFPLAYLWKIKLNETGKIPAFYNVLPELNHNEMNGFDVVESTKELSKKFHFFILKDSRDNPRIIKRTAVLERLYKDRGLPVETIEILGGSAHERIFSTLLTGDWFAFYTAQEYRLEAEQVPMVEEFKKLIA